MFFPNTSSARRLGAAFLLVLLVSLPLAAQFRPAVGIRQNTPRVHAFTNARIVVAPGRVVEKGTLVVRDGIIVGVGVTVPADARVWDLAGMTIYPGFIESQADIGMPKKPQQDQGKQADPRGGAKHWNDNVQASLRAEELFTPDPKAAEKLRSIGFTAALVVPQKGIFRGSSEIGRAHV
jgi:imidazolonepropionase-like amidohydrolase